MCQVRFAEMRKKAALTDTDGDLRDPQIDTEVSCDASSQCLESEERRGRDEARNLCSPRSVRVTASRKRKHALTAFGRFGTYRLSHCRVVVCIPKHPLSTSGALSCIGDGVLALDGGR